MAVPEHPGDPPLTPEELERQLQQESGDIARYLLLADLYKNSERWKEAEAVYARALQACGGDAVVQEKLEDVQIFLREQAIYAARARARANRADQEAEEIYLSLKRDLNTFEMDVYRRRTERNPTVKGLWAEYGLRLQKEKLFKEAIRAYEKARGDEERKAMILFGLGYCLQAEKKFQSAMSHYKEAEVAIRDLELDVKKEVLYSITRLAMQLEDMDTAREYLRRLRNLGDGLGDDDDCAQV